MPRSNRTSRSGRFDVIHDPKAQYSHGIEPNSRWRVGYVHCQANEETLRLVDNLMGSELAREFKKIARNQCKDPGSTRRFSARKSLAIASFLAPFVALPWMVNAEQLAQSGDAEMGQQLFQQNCMRCHGSNATGGWGPNIQGRDAAAIKGALGRVNAMSGISVSDDAIDDIAAYLGTLGN